MYADFDRVDYPPMSARSSLFSSSVEFAKTMPIIATYILVLYIVVVSTIRVSLYLKHVVYKSSKEKKRSLGTCSYL